MMLFGIRHGDMSFPLTFFSPSFKVALGVSCLLSRLATDSWELVVNPKSFPIPAGSLVIPNKFILPLDTASIIT
jgi:hypothetical protein